LAATLGSSIRKKDGTPMILREKYQRLVDEARKAKIEGFLEREQTRN